jgi:hypothetical protein
MGKVLGSWFVLAVAVLTAGPLAAQVPVGSSERGWTLYENLEGSSVDTGVATRFDSTLGYNTSRYFSADVGLPVYFISVSDSGTTGLKSASGIGDVYVDLRLTFRNPAVNFITNLRGTAPTGDTAKGLSTGRATYDWNNHFDHSFGRFTPYADLGVANTVPDAIYFVRPFSTLGTVGHFEAGLGVGLTRYFSVSASAYDIAPSGEQKIYSRVLPRTSGSGGGTGGGTGPMPVTSLFAFAPVASRGRPIYETAAETTGPASIAADNGYSAGISIFPTKFIDLRAGYSHSVHFHQDSAYFGVGFDVGGLWKFGRL